MKFAFILVLLFASLAFAQEEEYAVQDTFVEDEEEQQQPIEEEESMGIRQLAYKKIKELPDWADAEDC